MNMLSSSDSRRLARFFRAISQPARLKIIAAIGHGEACVCHLEAVLGMRQVYLSQHLMALRKSGMLTTRRDGRFIYYRWKDKNLGEILLQVAQITGIEKDALKIQGAQEKNSRCSCPNCTK